MSNYQKFLSLEDRILIEEGIFKVLHGINWHKLTQEDVDLMFSHINSTPRKTLGGKTPYEAFSFFYGENILKKLNIQKKQKDKVTLQPYLIKLK